MGDPRDRWAVGVGSTLKEARVHAHQVGSRWALAENASQHFGVPKEDIRIYAPPGAACAVLLVRVPGSGERALRCDRAFSSFPEWARWNVSAAVLAAAVRVRDFPTLPEEVLEAALLLGGPDGLCALVEVDDG